MSMFNLFGKARAPPTPTHTPSTSDTPAAVDLAEALELAEKREAHVMRMIAKEVETARACAASNNRRAALEAVKRKKLHEKELERLGGQKLNLMQTETTLSQLKFNSVMLQAEERGAAAIEREVKKVKGAEGVDRVLDRTEEALADADDVLGCSSRKMGPAADFDDDELLGELEEMELASELLDVTDVGRGAAAAAHAPVPSSVPVPLPVPRKTAAQIAEERAEERELAELVALQTSMATMAVEPAMPAPMMAAVEPRRPMPMTALPASAMKLEQPMVMPMMAACY